MIKNTTVQQILAKYKPVWALSYVNNLAAWDLETYMPEAGAKTRGAALAQMQVLIQKFFTEKDFVKFLDAAEADQDKLNDTEKGIIRSLRHSLDSYLKLPTEFLENFSETTNEAQVAWRKARENDDWQLFAPHLEKIYQLTREKADYLGYEEHPYDALLDEYEEGETSTNLDKYFAEIKPFLEDLLGYIKKSNNYQEEHELANEKYDKQALKQLDDTVLALFNYPIDRLRLDESTHPFTQSLSIDDVRITTRYPGSDYAGTLQSTIHEFGHALYELQINKDLQYTPIGSASSLGIHESQSRFWENFIGRDQAFLNLIYEKIQALSPDIANYSIDDHYQYFNNVSPSLIRTEADEVTYHFHIMIRYEIEKKLLEKELDINDAPAYWNQLYMQYLGVSSDNFKQGILQDIHWSMGAIGYFPTYSTGTVLSATIKQQLEADLGNIAKLINDKQDGFDKIKGWLAENVHQYGATYTFHKFVKMLTDKDFSSVPWQNYLTKKYKQLY